MLAGDASHYQLQRKCWRKRGYATMTLARKKAKKIYKESGHILYVYKCSACGRAHLTKNILAKGKLL